MVHIAISAEDAAILRDVLDGRLLELKKEIWHTDHHEFRAILASREAALERVLAQIDALAPHAADPAPVR